MPNKYNKPVSTEPEFPVEPDPHAGSDNRTVRNKYNKPVPPNPNFPVEPEPLVVNNIRHVPPNPNFPVESEPTVDNDFRTVPEYPAADPDFSTEDRSARYSDDSLDWQTRFEELEARFNAVYQVLKNKYLI